ncbi:dTDP-glucose 4,6-dehydratase [subsurface metagenome]
MADTVAVFSGAIMKTILVTGGAGFIGSNFVRMVLSEYSDTFVVNLDKLTYAGNLENLTGFLNHTNHKFIKGDICDALLIDKILDEHKIDAIINFAAESHVDRSIRAPKAFLETNVKGTLTLLEAARDRNLRRFIQISTDEVYGSLGPEGKFSEDTPLSPNSPYSASKAAADHLVKAFGHTWGLKYNITRCSNNYGPYQFPEKLIPLMINNALDDKELPVYGDGLYVRDWLYVGDHCMAVWKVLTEAPPGETYNIGGCNEKTNIKVIELILNRIAKPKSLIRHVTDRPGHDRRYAIDASKIIRQLNWQPSVSFEEGIEKTIDWYLQNQKWLANVVSGEYQQYYESMYSNRREPDKD